MVRGCLGFGLASCNGGALSRGVIPVHLFWALFRAVLAPVRGDCVNIPYVEVFAVNAWRTRGERVAGNNTFMVFNTFAKKNQKKLSIPLGGLPIGLFHEGD